MLLTSGQVSVALSSFIVVSFTGALFLSGYAVQQKTMRDIRIAIRPQAVSMQDRMYLPPQFDKSQIHVSGQEAGEFMVNMKQSSDPDPTNKKPIKNANGAKLPSQLDAKHENEDGQKPMRPEVGEQTSRAGRSDQPPVSNQARTSGNKKADKPLSRAARRKKIKEEILEAGDGEGFKGYKRRKWW